MAPFTHTWIQQPLSSAYSVPVTGSGSSSAVTSWLPASWPWKYALEGRLKVNGNDKLEHYTGRVRNALGAGTMETQPNHGAQKGLPCVQDVYTKKVSNIGQARGKE